MATFRVISLLIANTLPVAAAALGIGIVMSDGTVTINHAVTAGNATLFDGSTIETGSAGSRLHLNNGTTLQFSRYTRGTVFGDRLVLDKGATEIGGARYEVNARTLHIVGSDARVGVLGKMVEVAALTAPVRVSNARGVLVATVAPGKILDFTPLDESGADVSVKSKHVGIRR